MPQFFEQIAHALKGSNRLVANAARGPKLGELRTSNPNGYRNGYVLISEQRPRMGRLRLGPEDSGA